MFLNYEILYGYMPLILNMRKFEEVLDDIKRDYDNVRRVVDFVREKNGNVRFVIHSKSISSEKAAKEMNIDLRNIVKSLVFVDDSGKGCVVLVRGDKKVDEEKLNAVVGRKVRIADKNEVEELTGYRIGGVSPFAHNLKILMDRNILEVEEVHPSAGSTCIGLILSSKELLRLTNAEIVEICK